MANEQELLDDRKEKEEIIRNFRLMDDTFMSKVFEDKACAELLLRIILGRDDLTVQEAVTQYELKNIQGRSAKLDIYAVDSTGAKYDVEVQRSDKGAVPKRGQYNSSLLDCNTLDTGDNFEKLPKTYVIFITENDYFYAGLPMYTITRCITNMGNAVYGDESGIIYVNGANRDDSAVGKLMQDFFCKDPHKMNYELLSRRTEYFKESKEGVDTMCKLMEDYADKRARKAAEIAANEKSISIALKLWNNGIRDLQQIAELTDLPLEMVKELFKDKIA